MRRALSGCHQPAFPFAQEFNPAEFVSQPSPVQVELKRREGGKARVLARLQQGPATNEELVKLALRFGARIDELRKKHGYTITKEHIDGGLFRYALIGQGR